MNRLQAAEQLRRALQMYTNTLTEEQALEIASVYPAWAANRTYAVGEIISYGTNPLGDPQLYKVVQAHTSQADWIPGQDTGSLYNAFGLNAEGYPIWNQPSGEHDAYSVGDTVDYNGVLYESIINGNVWSPDVYPAGWKAVDSGGTTPEPEPTVYPDWVQPSGAHDAYNIGDIVMYNGTAYRSTVDGNVWNPEAYPTGWEIYNG